MLSDVVEETENHERLLSAPTTLEDLGLPYSLLSDLFLRRTLIDGTTSINGLANSLGLTIPIVEVVFQDFRDKKYLDVKTMIGSDYVFALTDMGRALANERMRQSQYATVAPVPLEIYNRVVVQQRARVKVTRESMRQAFSDLVVADDLLDELGPAIISQSSIFLYGPTGNGKTSLAERMIRVYDDRVLIPRAIEVDGQVITVFDPVIHDASDPQPQGLDPRWVLCRRPCVVTGGELIGTMLELHLDPVTGVYAAPLQMKANNGILIIDDFGRQLMSPAELLNRWIVPLDRRVDFLTLSYGVKFKIPFDVMVTFSTNLDPDDLGDDAFFRRIQNKVFIAPVADEEFDWILARVIRSQNVKCETGAPAHLRKICREMGNGELRACLPGDICDLLRALCEYEGTPLELNRRNLERAAALYFTRRDDDINYSPMPNRNGGARRVIED